MQKREANQLAANTHHTVIPAQAGIQSSSDTRG